MADQVVTVEAVLPVSPGRVAAVLGERSLWVRAATAAGAVADLYPEATGPVTDGDLMRLRRRGRSGRPGARSLILRADRPDGSGPPTWRVLAGPGPVRRVQVNAGPAGAGTRVTAVIDTVGGRRQARFRRALTATARRLLGLIDSTARAPRLVVAAAITRTGAGRVELLVGRCRSGEWELPGGKVEPRESEAQALRREIVEELGIRVVVGRRVGEPVDLGDGLQLRALAARIEAGEPAPQAREHTELRWVAAGELPALPWRPADRGWVPALTELLTGDRPGRPDPVTEGDRR